MRTGGTAISKYAFSHAYGFFKAGLHHLGIYLGRIDVRMAQKLADYKKVLASLQGKGGKCVSARVKSDMLVDSCTLGQSLNKIIKTRLFGQFGEHVVCVFRILISFWKPEHGVHAQG